MIRARHTEAIHVLQASAATHDARFTTLSAQVDASSTQLATLSAQVAASSSQFAVQLEHATADAIRIVQLERAMVETERVVAAQAEALRAQATQIDVLREQGERQAEAIRQIQGAVTRIERQAMIDLEEMRRTGAAMAQATLLGRLGSTPIPAGDRRDR